MVQYVERRAFAGIFGCRSRAQQLATKCAVSREPCVLIWSEATRLTKAEPKRKSTREAKQPD